MKNRRPNTLVSFAFICMAFCICPNLISQIKVGKNPGTINPNSALEIESDNKGLLLPRLALTSKSNAFPLSSFVQGMFVFNTATSNDVTPGIYYSDGSKWVKIYGGSSSSGSWNYDGNSGTDSTNNFIGTTDNAPLILKTNNQERFRITEGGWVGIGTSDPEAALHVNGEVIIDSLSSGNVATDSILVANPANGKVKMVSSNSFVMNMEKSTEVVQTSGQTIFNTPVKITDPDKVQLYRNGILISFTVINSNSIESEMPCLPGDEVKIFQLK